MPEGIEREEFNPTELVPHTSKAGGDSPEAPKHGTHLHESKLWELYGDRSHGVHLWDRVSGSSVRGLSGTNTKPPHSRTGRTR